MTLATNTRLNLVSKVNVHGISDNPCDYCGRCEAFDGSDVVYFFMANFAKDQDEWIKLLNMAG